MQALRIEPVMRPDRPETCPRLRRQRSPAGPVLVALALAGALAAQQRFDELRRPALPESAGLSSAVAFADFDGDGDLDAWLCQPLTYSSDMNRLLRNDGAGRFVDVTATHVPPSATFAFAVATGDVDGDGDLDVLTACRNGRTNRLYLNGGNGVFFDATATNLPADTDSTLSVALGDVDGDGDLDAVFGVHGSGPSTQNRLYLNDGTGRFTDHTATHLPVDADSTTSIALADVDGDRDLDVVLANWTTQNALWLNDGTGRYSVATAQLPVDQDATSAVAVGDVDRDGDVDLLFGGTSLAPFWNIPPDPDRLYLNDGTGRFTDGTGTRLPHVTTSTAAATLADVDADGDLDVLIGQGAQGDRLYLNDGAGTFTDATDTHVPFSAVSTTSFAVGDVDGDGHADVLAGYGPPDRLWLNDGTGRFVDAARARFPPARVGQLALGDVDGDGDTDVLAGAMESGSDRLYLNDGTGHFADVTGTWLPSVPTAQSSVVLGDVDGDGDLDAIGADGGVINGSVWMRRNDGKGDFRDRSTGWQYSLHFAGGSTNALALGDVDADGDLDLVRAHAHPGVSWPPRGGSQVLLNDGTGGFTPPAQAPAIFGEARAVALGDVDGDGDLDIVFGGPGALFTNDGTGTFTQVLTQPMPFDEVVALEDVDGDGDLDLLSGTSWRIGGPVRLGLNDGSGRFVDATAANMPPGPWRVTRIVAGDVDEDGDPDLVIGCSSEPLRLLENDGSGHFTDVSATSAPAGDPFVGSLAAADVDGDGDLDLVGTFDGAARVLVGLRRQLDVTWWARPGGTFTLDVYSRHAPSNTVDIAVPFVSPGAAAIPLPPLGTVAIDPARAVALPPVVVLQPAGVASLRLAVPNNPSLAGARIHAQAVLLVFPISARLTNAAVEVLRR